MYRDVLKEILEFRDDREWKQYHNAKDLAISISLEASELLEIFQWTPSEEAVENRSKEIKEEIADVLIYTMLLANDLNIDLEEIILEKLKVNGEKYPIEKARGSKDKYTDL
ncbi:MAG: nucleotide pyrophosphohydrolase [Tissierellia bacterium]|nr:nucleotide pyrophosphohydrolase [Tissierellia bacterium]